MAEALTNLLIIVTWYLLLLSVQFPMLNCCHINCAKHGNSFWHHFLSPGKGLIATPCLALRISRAMMQKSVEYEGAQQHSGASQVSIHCMVLDIQLLFLTSSTKCDASIECDALLDRIRKNSSILRTMQCISTTLLPLYCLWPAHSTDFFIIALKKTSGGVHTKNMVKSAVQLKWTRPIWHSATHLNARGSYDNKNWRAVAGFWSFLMSQKTHWDLLQRSNREWSPIILVSSFKMQKLQAEKLHAWV